MSSGAAPRDGLAQETGQFPRSFEGRGFHSSLAGGGAEGTISVGVGSVRFEAEGATPGVDLPITGLVIAVGGAADRLIFLNHPDRPDWSIYTSDRAILGQPALRADPDVAAQIGRIGRKRSVARLRVTLFFSLIGAAMVGLVALKDPIIRIVADRVPASVEVRLGGAAMSQLSIGRSFVVDPEVSAGVEAMTGRLVKAIPDRSYPFAFHVVEDPSINAFALPGGTVVLHTGLLLEAASPEEIAGVLAHEIAHVTERHAVRQILGTIGLFALVQAFFGDLTGVAAVLVSSGADLLSLRFSRDFEREADSRGLELLAAAQIDPAGMVSFFDKLRAKEGSGFPALLSTHPATEERIERLEKAIRDAERSGRAAPLSLDFAAFQKRLRTVARAPKETGGVR